MKHEDMIEAQRAAKKQRIDDLLIISGGLFALIVAVFIGLQNWGLIK